jgi:surface protein
MECKLFVSEWFCPENKCIILPPEEDGKIRLFRGTALEVHSYDCILRGTQVGKKPQVTNMSNMFYGASSFKFASDLSAWQTGQATDMSNMFCEASSFTSDLSAWQTGQATDMSNMFCEASSFTSDLSPWQTGQVTESDMSGMFCEASSFTSEFTSFSGRFDIIQRQNLWKSENFWTHRSALMRSSLCFMVYQRWHHYPAKASQKTSNMQKWVIYGAG